MLIKTLFEDATGDLQAYGRAAAIITALMSHLRDAGPHDHYGFKAYRFDDGEMCLTLRGSDIGLTGDDAGLWFRFGALKGFVASGNISRFKRSGETVITLDCLDDMMDTEAAAKTILYSKVVRDVLIHEVTHYLDSQRNAGFFEHPTGRLSNSDEWDRYFNHPSEVNGYFANLASPMLHFLEATQDEDGSMVERFAKGVGLSRDFKATLERLLDASKAQANGALIKRWWSSLNERNRRSVMRRLVALHEKVVARLDAS